jgi:hypothetical protein
MADNPELSVLVSRIAAYDERAATARRLASEITDQRAIDGLIERAKEYERKGAELEAQLAVLKLSLQDGAVEQEIAALKPLSGVPPKDDDPKTG